jgi:hypothetical protein
MCVRVEALSAVSVEVTMCWDVRIANILMKPACSAFKVTLGILEKAIFILAHFDAIRLPISFLVTISVRVCMKEKTSYSQIVSIYLSIYIYIYSCCTHLERRASV